MIKAVIFDCFGVLTEDGWLAFCSKYRTSENTEELSDLNHQVDRGILGYEDFLNEVHRLTGADPAEAHKTITTTHHPNEQLFEYIRKLKIAGYTLGVISNVGSELTTFLPKELVDLFDEVTLSYHVRAIKPEPEIYLYHLEQLEIEPNECVFIDDRPPNTEGALAVGMNGITYTTAGDVIAKLEELGVTAS